MPQQAEALPISDNDSLHRFETSLDGHVAFLDYVRRDDRVLYTHTLVPPELEGRGIAGQLAKHALDDARTRNLKVVARCPFVASYIDRHPEYEDLAISEEAPAR